MTVIKNGKIIDGTGEKAYTADMLIEDGIIADIGKIDIEGAEIIDAKGKCVTPGFIDAHRHHDIAVLYDENFGEAELRQGITTAIAGNCGLAPAPTTPEILDYIEPCLGRADCNFISVADYITQLKNNDLPLNVGVLCATGSITAAVKGYGKGRMTEEQLRKACKWIEEGVQAGALGLSCGIMYDPECYTAEEEFVAMAKAAAKHGGYLTSHIRGEGNSLAKSIEEIIRIAKKADISLNISHFKVTGIKNWGKGLDEAIELIEKAGNVTVDCYPYIAGSTTIMSLLPPTVKNIHDCEFLKKEIYREHADWDNMVSSIGFENIGISSVMCEDDRKFCGMNMKEAADFVGIEPHVLMSELIERNNGKVGVILYSMAQSDVNRVLSLPYCSVISDSLYGGGDNPHPRLYGSFPRVIRKCVREDKLFSLETAVRKMTGMPADRLGLRDRGYLKKGMKADVLIFDEKKISDKATFEDAKQYCVGLDKVIVNGVIAVDKDRLTGTKAGEFAVKE
ncbi:MAG: amidohydrolase family protein [Clostridia bacterium]|nr:amidohydrolase family protein [Clostridia bacterium]